MGHNQSQLERELSSEEAQAENRGPKVGSPAGTLAAHGDTLERKAASFSIDRQDMGIIEERIIGMKMKNGLP